MAALGILATVGFFLSLSLVAFASWSLEQLRKGIAIEGIAIRATGLGMKDWQHAGIDTLVIGIPTSGLTIRANQVRLTANPVSWPQGTGPCVAELSAAFVGIRVDTSVHTPKSTTPPVWPKLDLPLSAWVRLDTIEIDVGHKVRLLDVQALAWEGHRLSVRTAKVSSRGIPVDGLLSAQADWRAPDSLQLQAAGRVWGGCCSNDSFALSAKLLRSDLTRGRAEASFMLSDVSSWSDVVPQLAHVPHLGRWDVNAKVQSSVHDTSLELHVRGNVAEFFPLPAGMLDLGASSSSKGTQVQLDMTGKDDFLIRAKLSNPARPSRWTPDLKATGEILVRSWNLHVPGHAIPLDARIDVDRLDRKGAEVRLHMRSGSEIQGSAGFAPLTWKVHAVIAPTEPWATVWLPGLAMDSGGTINGHDTGNGTAFEVTARHPNWWKLRLDSLQTRLWLNTKHLVFESIRTFDGPRQLQAKGEVSWTDWIWRFEAFPISDSASYAQVHGNIPATGAELNVQAQMGDFPLEFFPNPQIRQKLFNSRFTGGLIHKASPGSNFDWASGRLRARPGGDSLTANFDFTRVDNAIQLRSLVANLGPDRLRATLEGHLTQTNFQLDTLALDLDSLHLERAIRLANPHAQAGGLLKGHFRSGPSEGLRAQAQLEDGWIEKEGGGTTQLPNLQLWGMRDTLNIGGFWLLGNTRAPFKLTVNHIFDAHRDISLVAFPSELLRLRAQGSVDSFSLAQLRFDLTGEYNLGSNGSIKQISARGEAHASKEGSQWQWNAQATSDPGARFLAPGGNGFALDFKLHANPTEIRLDTASLVGTRGGYAGLQARYDLQRNKLKLGSQIRNLELGIGPNRNLSVSQADVTTVEDGSFQANVRNARLRESYGKGQELDARIRDAHLSFLDTKDWSKLSGSVALSSARYSKSIPEPKDVLKSLGSDNREISARSDAGKPLLLDLHHSSEGDSVLLENNVARARLTFEMSVNGTSSSPILTGSVSTSDSSSTFQYVGKTFQIEEFQLAWAGQSVDQGRYNLSGSRKIRHSCTEDVQLDASTQDQCSIVLNSSGTLAHPQLEPPIAKTCAADATAQTSLQAMTLGCYPQSQSNSSSNPYLQMGTSIAVGQMRSWVNDVVNSRLKGQNDPGLEFLPDSLTFKELPKENAGPQDRMVIAAGKKLGERFDIEAEYAHVFTARADATSTANATGSSVSNATTTSTTNVATDDYTLRLRYHPPFHWVEDSLARTRLEERVLLQVETRQSKGWIPGRETLLKPSLRYRWEFW